VFVNDRFTVRLEVRDLAYSAHVSRVNGCNLGDVQLIVDHPDGNYAGGTLSSGCSAGAFGGTEQTVRTSAAGAAELLRNPSSEVINNILFQGGISWLF
jgi:hypothetical protein